MHPIARLPKHLTSLKIIGGRVNYLTKNIKHCVLRSCVLDNIFLEHPLKKLSIDVINVHSKCIDNLTIQQPPNLPRDHFEKNSWNDKNLFGVLSYE